jgi:hypothetical protein
VHTKDITTHFMRTPKNFACSEYVEKNYYYDEVDEKELAR